MQFAIFCNSVVYADGFQRFLTRNSIEMNFTTKMKFSIKDPFINRKKSTYIIPYHEVNLNDGLSSKFQILLQIQVILFYLTDVFMEAVGTVE